MMEVHRQSGGFTPPVEAKRRFIRLWRVPPLGVEDAAERCPVKCF